MGRMSAHGLEYRCLVCGGLLMGTACLCHSGEQESLLRPPRWLKDTGSGRRRAPDHGWREPDVSCPRPLVRVDGKISVPLIGEVDAVGLTTAELRTSWSRSSRTSLIARRIGVYQADQQPEDLRVGKRQERGASPPAKADDGPAGLNGSGRTGRVGREKEDLRLRKIDGKQVKMPF